MGVTKELFVNLEEKYEKVKKLIEEDSKLDPENEPYISKYAAKQLLISMKANLEKFLDQSQSPENNDKLTAMLAIVWFYLGMISVDTEELTNGENQLNNALALTEQFSLQPTFILIVLNTLNQLGILWSHRDDVEKSKEYLEKSQKLYVDFKALNIEPISFNELFKSSDENKEVAKAFLEKTHTLTLYYLAQVYGNLKDPLKSAFYCHVTLKRQLEFNDYDHIDWALNAATLSQFFMEKNGFTQARHHLAASLYMLCLYNDKLTEIRDESEEYLAKRENYEHRSADVSRCWAKYGLLLMSNSRDRLLNDEDYFTPPEEFSDMVFSGLDLNVYEHQITDQFLLTFEDARLVFINIQSWLLAAQTYYNLENHATDYAQIFQDMSQMYNYLAFFEDDPDRQSKMHKRRIILLEQVAKELNPTYYLQICRQIWYELGEIYVNILEIKLDKLKESTERPTPHSLTKINNLIQNAISHFDCFLNSVKELSTEDKLSIDLEKPVLKAYFHIAVLYGKYISPDKNIQLENSNKSLKYYEKMVKYCDKFEDACEHIKTELGVSREMAALLPLKLIKISQEIQT